MYRRYRFFGKKKKKTYNFTTTVCFFQTDQIVNDVSVPPRAVLLPDVSNTVLPILVIACNRITITQNLDQLIK